MRGLGQSNSRRIALNFESIRPEILASACFVIGAIAGGLANLWAMALTSPREPAQKQAARSSGWYQLIPVLGTGLLFAAFALAVVRFHCQDVPEVRPDDFWRSARIVYHLVLIALLVAATSTDLREYVIPDQITLPGMIIGLSAAVFSGQLQLEHVWVDWNQEVPGIAGPYIPDWLDAHRHWHGLAWSLAGGLVGAGLTWFVRGVSALVLKRKALGFGDVTLMAMIGTFIGWQPIVFVFGLAPLCGLAFTIPLSILARKAWLPYGPFLAAATVIVLFSWRWLWASTRLVFGHAVSLALVGAAAAAALVILLVILRIYETRFREPAGESTGAPGPDGTST